MICLGSAKNSEAGQYSEPGSPKAYPGLKVITKVLNVLS